MINGIDVFKVKAVPGKVSHDEFVAKVDYCITEMGHSQIAWEDHGPTSCIRFLGPGNKYDELVDPKTIPSSNVNASQNKPKLR